MADKIEHLRTDKQHLKVGPPERYYNNDIKLLNDKSKDKPKDDKIRDNKIRDDKIRDIKIRDDKIRDDKIRDDKKEKSRDDKKEKLKIDPPKISHSLSKSFQDKPDLVNSTGKSLRDESSSSKSLRDEPPFYHYIPDRSNDFKLTEERLYSAFNRLQEYEIKLFKSILNTCLRTIELEAKAGKLYCLFPIPPYVFGKTPGQINIELCAVYMQNNFPKYMQSTFYPPNSIVISWFKKL